MKVFRIDEMTWIAAEDIDQAIDYATKEFDIFIGEDCPEECNTSIPAMWWVIDETPSGMDWGDTQIIDGVEYGWWNGEPAKFISYEDAHKLYGETLPYVIASCSC